MSDPQADSLVLDQADVTTITGANSLGAKPALTSVPAQNGWADLYTQGGPAQGSAAVPRSPVLSPVDTANSNWSLSTQPAAGFTLRQALRSTVSLNASRPIEDSGAASDRLASQSPTDIDLNTLLGFDPSRALLDSTTLGSVLATVIRPNASDGAAKSFSVFGLGQFVVDVTPNSHSVDLTEMTTGIVLPIASTMPLQDDFQGTPSDFAGRRHSAPNQSENVSIYRFLIELSLAFLGSPAGMVSTILAGLVGLIWTSSKLVTLLQRPTPNSRRRWE
jgi:hypothetical protein